MIAFTTVFANDETSGNQDLIEQEILRQAGQDGPGHETCDFTDQEEPSILSADSSLPKEQQSKLNDALFYAIRRSGIDTVKTRIEEGGQVHARSKQLKTTPLHAAAVQGKEEMITLFLELGADPLAINKNKKTPRDIILESTRGTQEGRDRIIKILESAERTKKQEELNQEKEQENPNQTDPSELTPEEETVTQNEQPTTPSLELPAEEQECINQDHINLRNDDGHTPLQIALRNNDFDEALRLFQEDALVCPQDYNSPTLQSVLKHLKLLPPLHVYVSIGSPQDISDMIDAGHDINLRNHYGYTTLKIALLLGNFDIALLLFQRGALADPQDYNSPTLQSVLKHLKLLPPLHVGVSIGNLRDISSMIDEGYNINLRDGYGYTPLQTALLLKNFSVALFLFQRGALADPQDYNSLTLQDVLKYLKLLPPLHQAVANKNLQGVTSTLNEGHNINLRDAHGYTPLQIALTTFNFDIALLLIQGGAVIEPQDYDTFTLQHILTYLSHQEPSNQVFAEEHVPLSATLHLGLSPEELEKIDLNRPARPATEGTEPPRKKSRGNDYQVTETAEPESIFEDDSDLLRFLNGGDDDDLFAYLDRKNEEGEMGDGNGDDGDSPEGGDSTTQYAFTGPIVQAALNGVAAAVLFQNQNKY